MRIDRKPLAGLCWAVLGRSGKGQAAVPVPFFTVSPFTELACVITGILDKFYRLLMKLSCVSMVSVLVAIMLGVAVREFHRDIQGLDGDADYAIAATLFLALPGTLKHGDPVRVTLVMQRLSCA